MLHIRHATRPCAPSCMRPHQRRALGRCRAAGPEPAPGQASVVESACLHVLRSVMLGRLSPEEAAREIRMLSNQPPAMSQSSKAYTPKIILGAGDISAADIVEEVRSLLPHQHTVLATHIEPDVYEAVKQELPDVQYNARARTLSLRSELSGKKPEKQPGTVAIISGSTVDLAVAEECRMVAEHCGCYVFQLKDLKVAAMDRVLANLAAIRAADVLVVVAGLDGALPSVIAGLVDAPVIAVPTSTGHGASLHGMAPMLASLSTSTPVSVVNIDDGCGAALMAMRILRQASKLHNARLAAQQQANAAANGASTSAPSGYVNGGTSSHPSSSWAMQDEDLGPMDSDDLMILGANGMQTLQRRQPAAEESRADAEVMILGPRCAWPSSKKR